MASRCGRAARRLAVHRSAGAAVLGASRRSPLRVFLKWAPAAVSLPLRRYAGTDAAGGEANAVGGEGVFRDRVDETLIHIHDCVDDACEDNDLAGYDSHFADGVLNIDLGERGHFVVNIQVPNRQIWLSSPVSGPARFELDEGSGEWRGVRSGETLEKMLSAELEELCGFAVPV